MGDPNVATSSSGDAAGYMRALLSDVKALERMVLDGRIESGVARIGAEQEFFLVDADFRPAPVALEVLEAVGDPRLTTELARFNLEANLSPQGFGGSCLKAMRGELESLLACARGAARARGAGLLLTGILPTLRPSDLGLDNMTPEDRYRELDRALRAERGGDVEVRIRGLDTLEVTHDNVMLESCNTSLQLHLQVDPDAACAAYNLSQAVTAPLLAAAANSPTLFGRRLWSETRVALFECSVDLRTRAGRQKGEPPRVFFGSRWLEGSPVEQFRENVSRFRPIVRCRQADEAPMAVLDRGEVPRLSALSMHAGTVYRWNRLCFGRAGGVAHLRIENRALPSGPSVVDEMANAAFFFGVMTGLAPLGSELPSRMPFDDAKENFFRAARHGLEAQLRWLDGTSYPADRLILDVLLPAAERGLSERGVDADDIGHYLGTIEARVKSGRTGARWALDSLGALGSVAPEQRMRTLTAAMVENEGSGAPVSSWPLASPLRQREPWRRSRGSVGQLMSTDLYSVRADDVVELAANLMDWHEVRHVPVEDADGQLVGIVSHRAFLRAFAREGGASGREVGEVMEKDPVTVEPTTDTLVAMQLMRDRRLSALPVVEAGRLVGILTERDLVHLATELLERAGSQASQHQSGGLSQLRRKSGSPGLAELASEGQNQA